MYIVYYGRGMSFSPVYLLLLIAIGISIWASYKVNSTFAEYAAEPTMRGMTGSEVARVILNRNGVNDVTVQAISGQLTDHYDPISKTLRLSEAVYNESSISAVSVAAHEVGHAIQHKEGYAFLRFRNMMAPVVSFSSRFVFVLIMVGFMIEFSGLINLGIVLFSLSVLFQIITLPVDFDASARALKNLEGDGIITADEKKYSKKVLNAAAMTYVASTLVSIMQLIRFIGMRRD